MDEAPARAKRGRGDDDDADMGARDMGGSTAPKPVCSEWKPRARTSDRNAAKDILRQWGTADEFGLNYPLPWEESRSRDAAKPCIVKTYDADAESLRLGEIVEVLGVLCVNPELANLEGQEEDAFGNDARHPSTSLVPRLHALFVRKLPFYHPAFPFTPAWLSEARLATAYQANFSAPGTVAAVRQAALAQLEQQLGGDALAAEYALMSMLARCFAKEGDSQLGTWSLNITHWPQEMEVSAFAAAAGELVPRCVCLDVSCQTLGQRSWKPTKDYGANRLLSAQLQLAPGTLLVLDETAMGEGQLAPAGVTAIRTIGQLVTEGTLACDFSAYDVPVPLELQIVLVSRGRSIVKEVDLALPLKAVSPSQLGKLMDLSAARLYLGFATRLPKALEITEEMADRVAGDFVEARQEFQVSSGLCNTWLSLARAYCLSHGEAQLTEGLWSKLLDMERQRLRRCMEAGFLTTARD